MKLQAVAINKITYSLFWVKNPSGRIVGGWKVYPHVGCTEKVFSMLSDFFYINR